MVARLARGDVNMPDFDGFSIEKQAPEARFEVAVHELLRSEPKVRASRLLHYRVPLCTAVVQGMEYLGIWLVAVYSSSREQGE